MDDTHDIYTIFDDCFTCLLPVQVILLSVQSGFYLSIWRVIRSIHYIKLWCHMSYVILF